MVHSDLRRSAEACEARFGVLGLSLWVAAVPKLDDLVAQTTPHIQKYGHLAICSLAVLDGYNAIATGRAPHYTLVLPDTEDATLDEFRECFRIISNPLAGD